MGRSVGSDAAVPRGWWPAGGPRLAPRRRRSGGRAGHGGAARHTDCKPVAAATGRHESSTLITVAGRQAEPTCLLRSRGAAASAAAAARCARCALATAPRAPAYAAARPGAGRPAAARWQHRALRRLRVPDAGGDAGERAARRCPAPSPAHARVLVLPAHCGVGCRRGGRARGRSCELRAPLRIRATLTLARAGGRWRSSRTLRGASTTCSSTRARPSPQPRAPGGAAALQPGGWRARLRSAPGRVPGPISCRAGASSSGPRSAGLARLQRRRREGHLGSGAQASTS